MAGTSSAYFVKSVVDYYFNGGTLKTAVPLYLALFTDDNSIVVTTAQDGRESEMNNLTEPTFGYARILLTTQFTTPTEPARLFTHTADLTWPTASGGDWGTFNTVCVMDSATINQGNCLGYLELASGFTIDDGDTALTPSQSIKISL